MPLTTFWISQEGRDLLLMVKANSWASAWKMTGDRCKLIAMAWPFLQKWCKISPKVFFFFFFLERERRRFGAVIMIKYSNSIFINRSFYSSLILIPRKQICSFMIEKIDRFALPFTIEVNYCWRIPVVIEFI